MLRVYQVMLSPLRRRQKNILNDAKLQMDLEKRERLGDVISLMEKKQYNGLNVCECLPSLFLFLYHN